MLAPDTAASWENVSNFLAGATLSVTGEHNHFNLEYTYGRQNNPEIVNRNSNIHHFNLYYDREFSAQTRLSVLNLTTYTTDYTPFDTYSGERPVEPEYRPTPSIYMGRADQLQNYAEVRVRRQITALAELEFLYGNRVVHYGESSEDISFSDTMQHIFEGGYLRQLTPHFSAGCLYRFRYMDFADYERTYSHAVLGSMRWQIRPSLHLEGTAGPLYANNGESDSSDVFLNARVTLSKSFQRDNLSLSYSRDLADTAGVLGASRSDVVYASWGRPLWRDLHWDVFGGYILDQMLEETTRVGRWLASSSIRYEIDERFEVFGVYRWTQQNVEEAGRSITRRHQVMFGVRFTLPHLWRKQG
jgi:hypothetical protein